MRLAFAIAAIFFLSGYGWAQSGSTAGTITGSVKDQQGAAVAGAAVTVRHLETNAARAVQTEDDGSYILVQMPPGKYEIAAQSEGFAPARKEITLVLGVTALNDFTLVPDGSSEVIEVTAGDDLQAKTESSSNIAREQIDNLPINRRNFLDFTLTTPRVVRDRGPGQGVISTSGLSFNGQSARFNNITIDGLDNNEALTGSVRSTYSQEAVQEFQVVSDSFSAEFGRALGGVVNIVTRGGSNEYHGNLFFLNRNDETSARDVFSPFEPKYKQNQFGGTISGPVKKDRAFFFGSFERLSVRQSNFVTIGDESVQAARRRGFALSNGPVPFSIGTTSILARLDYRITPNDSLFLRYNFGGTYNGAFEAFGALFGETNGGKQLLDDDTIAVSNTYFNPGLNLVNETRFLYGNRDQNVVPPENGPRVQLVAPEGFIQFGRSALSPQPRVASFYQIVNNATLIRGRNQIKFGADFSYAVVDDKKTKVPIFSGGTALFLPLDFSSLLGRPGLPSFTGLQAFDPALRTTAQRDFLITLSALLPVFEPEFPRGLDLTELSLPIAFAQGFGKPEVALSQKQFALFVQDDIKLLPNLLLKAGLRYDINRTLFVPGTKGGLSPRIALSYRPSWLSKLNLRGAYGLFYCAPLYGNSAVVELTSVTEAIKIPVILFPFSIVPFSLPGHKFPEGATLPQGVSFVPQLSSVFTYQPNAGDSYTQQITGGFDYAISDNTAVAATYSFVRGIKLLSLRNINPIVRPVPGDQIASQMTGRVDPSRGDVFEFETAFDSYYHGLTVSFRRRFKDRFDLLAHYTVSKAIDNFIDIASTSQETEDSLNIGNERGLSLQDVRQRFVLSGIWDLGSAKSRLLKGFQLSAILNLESGRPYNLLAGQDLNMNGDSPPGDRPEGLGRNVGIAPGFAGLDLRLTRSANIGDRIRLQFIAEAFNVFNRVNISEVDRIFPPDAEGRFNLPAKQGGRFTAPRERYRGAFAPRQFQFGFKQSSHPLRDLCD